MKGGDNTMQYETKRIKITRHLKAILKALKENDRTGNKEIICSTCAIELGVKEREVEEVLDLFRKAQLIEVTENEIIP
jgi:formate-dependent nitrite reductase cytochrome c552 subunit